MPTHSPATAFSCPLLLGALTAPDKLDTLVSQFTQSWGGDGLGGCLGSRGISLAFYMYACTPCPFQSRFFYLRVDGCYVLLFFCKLGASEEIPLCTGLCWELLPEKGKGISLFDIFFFPHASLAERCSRKIRGNSDLLFVFLPRRASQYGNFISEAFLIFGSVQGTMYQQGSNVACSLPQKWSTNKS